MKALLLSEYRRLELVDLPAPEIGEDEVLVRVAACGVCGSDVHGYDGSTGRRIPPIVMGHEAAGIVEATGSGVSRFRAGDRVTFDSTIFCGECGWCRSGRNNLCDRREVLGVSCGDYRRHGAFAEVVAIPERVLHGLPDSLPLEHAALTEAVAVAVHAARIAPVAEGDDVVVVGTGLIGLLVVQALRTANCGRILAIDVDDGRLAMARRFGAAVTFNPREGDVVERVLEATDGLGAAVALEVVGTSATIDTAVRSVRRAGAVTLVGNVSPRPEIPLQMVVNRELTLRGSCSSNGEYPECIELMARGDIDVKPLISACVPLAEAPHWFERLYAREPGLMKVVVTP